MLDVDAQIGIGRAVESLDQTVALDRIAALFEMPLAVAADECQTLGRNLEYHAAALARRQRDLLEVAQAARIGYDRCHVVVGL